MTEILRYAAFTEQPEGGNPAGVVLDAAGLDAATMQAIAAEVGYSETAFLVARPQEPGHYDVRYFAPQGEVPFCGHATIAAGVAAGDGDKVFHTPAGEIPVLVREGRATLTSVAPHTVEVPELPRALHALRWDEAELDPALPPRIAFAGARHLVLAAATRDRLARLDYDFEALRAYCLDHDLITVALVFREAETRFAARDPFPYGGVVEDPATGAAAAAFGGYLRELGLVTPPVRVEIRQGEDMGRPSLLLVDIEAERPEIRVSGAAVPIA